MKPPSRKEDGFTFTLSARLDLSRSWLRLPARGLANGRTVPKSGDRVGARMDSASGAIWRTTVCAEPSPMEPPSYFTKTIDISLRINTDSGSARGTRLSARSQLGIRMARRPFSISSVTGVVGASAISSVWGPDSWKGIGNISKNAGVSFGATAAFNLVREFTCRTFCTAPARRTEPVPYFESGSANTYSAFPFAG